MTTETGLARIAPTSMAELQTFATAVAASKFYGFADASQAFVAISAGMDLGLSHAQSARAWHVINGKPTLTADAMRAVCLASPSCEYFEVREKSDERCTMSTKRRGSTAERVVTWTMADAKRAGLGGGNWAKYPRAMLQARATAELAREVYPDLLLGIYAPEEIEAVADAVASTPRVARDPEPVAAEVVEEGHHPTWDRDRGGFHARLTEYGVDYYDLAAWLESRGRGRPSALTTAQRRDLLDALAAPEGRTRTALASWLAARAASATDDAREPGEEG